MKKRAYKGVDPGRKPKDEKIKMKPEDWPDESMIPAYIKKYFDRTEEGQKKAFQLKLFGNPYAPNY